MAAFIRVRNSIRRFFSRHEIGAQRLWHGVLVFIALYVINSNFGYLDILNHTWVAVLLAVLCAFIPFSGSGVILAVVLVMHLSQMALDVAIVTSILFIVSYLICSFYRAKRTFYISLLPVLRQLTIPYAAPMESGLLGNVGELSAVICGGVMSFYLNDVKTNAALLIDEAEDLGAIDLLLQMIQNRLFYIYMIALVAMFLVIFGVKYLRIHYAWLISIIFGVLTEFVIMLAGYLFAGYESRVPQLIRGSVITLLFGIVINYFFRDLDYSRVERVQFEDDEYYYYVTAVPKNTIEEEQKKVTKITTDLAGGKE